MLLWNVRGIIESVVLVPTAPWHIPAGYDALCQRIFRLRRYSTGIMGILYRRIRRCPEGYSMIFYRPS